MPDSPEKPHLGNNWIDHSVSAARAAVGMTPIVGGLLGEIITQLVPNQRADRLAKYLAWLEGRIEHLEAETRDFIRKDAESIALIEDGAYAAARATSDKRIERIVQCVADGLAGMKSSEFWARRLLALYGELDDEEVALLFEQYCVSILNFGPHAVPIDAGRNDKSASLSHKDRMAAARSKEASLAKLERLGLLYFVNQMRPVVFPTPGNQVTSDQLLPVYDSGGRPKGRRSITYLAVRLLLSIGLIPELPNGAESLPGS